MPDYWIITLLALGTALATGLGALPLLWMRKPRPSLVGYGNSIAAGLMLGASLTLVMEGWKSGVGAVAAGLLIGGAFMLMVDKFLPQTEYMKVAGLTGTNARRALLLFLVMTFHSFAEGIGVGVSFGSGQAVGIFISLAIAVHNIPEGLAISLSMVPRGVSVTKAALFSIASSLPQPLMALPAFLFVEQFRSALPVGLGFAAGAMVWMVAKELLPEAVADTGNKSRVAMITTVSLILMTAFSLLVL